MPRWPLLLLGCAPSCASPNPAPAAVPIVTSSPAVFVEARCHETPGEIERYFEGRIALRLPAEVDAKEVRGKGHIILKPVEVGCDRVPIWINLMEIRATSISFHDLLDVLLRTRAGSGPRRPLQLEFIRPHLDGFSMALSDIDSSDARHVYVRVMMPSNDDPPCYHVLRFHVQSRDWDELLPILSASVDSLVRPRH